MGPYLALPGKVVFGLSALVQRDQEVCARVTILQGKTGIGHFLPRGSYINMSINQVRVTTVELL